MRPTSVPLPVLAVALHACTTEPELLNSERIRAYFGSYGIEVLSNDADLRRTSLYSVDGETRTCRTYAVVQFLERPHDRAELEHAQIIGGGSIGEVFKSHGWRIYKQTLHIGSIDLAGADSQPGRLMRLDRDTSVAIHVYRLLIEQDDVTVHYAMIIEVHHPEYLGEAELRRLFPSSESELLSEEQLAALVSLVTYSETH